MELYKSLIRPLLFRQDAEKAHDRGVAAARALGRFKPVRDMTGQWLTCSDPVLKTNICGLKLPNPVGLAAGWDKSGLAIEGLAAMGFGSVEIGSISACVSYGNPRPRLWRLPLDEAIVVFYGIPNYGADLVFDQVQDRRMSIPLGININSTNFGVKAVPLPKDKILADYLYSAKKLGPIADYLVLTLNCPNTAEPDLFSQKGNLSELLSVLIEANLTCPVFLKLSPEGGVEALERVLEEADGFDFVKGFIFNLSPLKPHNLITPKKVWESMPGAVSGRPVEEKNNGLIREIYLRMDKKRYHIIGSGGIFTAEDAYRKIRMGSSAVQILTSLIYEGPFVVKRINQGLARLLTEDGFKSVSEAVGVDSN